MRLAPHVDNARECLVSPGGRVTNNRPTRWSQFAPSRRGHFKLTSREGRRYLGVDVRNRYRAVLTSPDKPANKQHATTPALTT